MSGTDSLFSPILRTCFTKAELHRRITILRDFLEAKFFMAETHSLQDWLTMRHISEHDIAVILSWGKPFFDAFTAKNIYQVINDLNAQISSLAILTIYLPFAPLEKDIEILGIWCRKNVSARCLLDIRSDPSLVAGCSISWNGVFRDYSIHSFIEEAREEVKQLIGQYAKA